MDTHTTPSKVSQDQGTVNNVFLTISVSVFQLCSQTKTKVLTLTGQSQKTQKIQ